ncbi:MCE-family lipoprotein LprK (MCE-family lipoprotein Mce1e) [Streptomyces ambofaciens]|uniref:MCE-family lipoprotein LprK (MCE-family lipoprotein Mce1e) n=2 Tax=Streptomyces ambofaciens TaxID=1889 RepID=A0ABN4PGK9_STRAM|nr:MCE family protein [Streptomyces ambofaciens]ANB10422.1 MCE-family lipoprotein LprK (MCE-family lipoprotein Mce1e) [Streptomyces ambofaciens]CAJ88133.1 putative secreted protein [Streptomyces ambofaciens ATCC 23877]
MRRGARTTGTAVGAGLGGVLALGLGFALALGAFSVTAPRFGGIEDLPLPGGADLGSHPYTVSAELDDVLSLVPQAAVKVNDVAVGRVTEIRLDGDDWSARVTMEINGDVRLPADATARLEQSSLLGEKYVQLSAPAEPAAGRLADGAVIPLVRTGRNTEVEEVFGALSLLLNGGGVNQLKTITQELNKALGGREPEVRSMLRRVEKLVGNLDDHRGDITDALDAVNRLSSTLAGRKDDVRTVLTDLSPGLKTLHEQRGSLLTMLRSLDTLSGVAVSTVEASKDDMVADLKAIAPTLKALADAGTDLPDSLQVLLTYPFTDEVLNGVKGDYLNVYLTMTAAPGTQIIPPLVPRSTPSPSASPQRGRDSASGKRSGAGARGGATPSAPLPLPSVSTPPGNGDAQR